MSTNQQIIDRALLEIDVIESGNSADATDSADALTYLNEMMAEWAVSDRDFSFFAQDDLTETCPIPLWAESGVISNLAIALSAPFSAVVSAAVAKKADEGIRTITRTLINLNLEGADMSHLPQGSLNQRYNIQTDS